MPCAQEWLPRHPPRLLPAHSPNSYSYCPDTTLSSPRNLLQRPVLLREREAKGAQSCVQTSGGARASRTPSLGWASASHGGAVLWARCPKRSPELHADAWGSTGQQDPSLRRASASYGGAVPRAWHPMQGPITLCDLMPEANATLPRAVIHVSRDSRAGHIPESRHMRQCILWLPCPPLVTHAP